MCRNRNSKSLKLLNYCQLKQALVNMYDRTCMMSLKILRKAIILTVFVSLIGENLRNVINILCNNDLSV